MKGLYLQLKDVKTNLEHYLERTNIVIAACIAVSLAKSYAAIKSLSILELNDYECDVKCTSLVAGGSFLLIACLSSHQVRE